MSYKTIVVHLDADARRTERLALGCGLAASFDAHLVGLFAVEEAGVPAYALAEGAAIVVQQYQQWRERSEAEAGREFQDQARRCGLGKAEWRSSTLDAVRALRLSGRYADLLVVGQREPGELRAYSPGEIVLEAGRPVLVVPYAGRFAAVGKRVLIAWNASREAARAVTDALPLLERAQHVEIVAFDPQTTDGDHGEEPGADIALFLARHGVKATAAQQHAGIDVGEQILSRAADADADLIVMGAYGHSRARELVLGGATRTILASMTVPVLLSH
jgi:nucleotide-binding universal stress UspA family protein